MNTLKGYDIVCISNIIWIDCYTKSSVELIGRLAADNRLLVVDYPYTIKDVLSALTGKRHLPVKRMLGMENRMRKISNPDGTEILHLILPPILPFAFANNFGMLYYFLLDINGFIVRRYIRKILLRLKFTNTIVINSFNPFFGPYLAGRLREKWLIYYCYDGVSTIRHGQRSLETENKFIPLCDGIIVSSEALLTEKKKLNDNVVLVKNGVSFRLFHSAYDPEKKPAGRKQICYTGSVDHRFDTDLMVKVISECSEMDFLFVGRVTNPDAKKRLDLFTNIRYFYPMVRRASS